MSKVSGKIQKNKSKSKRAGLVLPVQRIRNYLRDGQYAKRIGTGAAVYLTAAVEYLVTELLDIATRVAIDNKKGRVQPRHILLAVKHDEEYEKMLAGVTISAGGVRPSIQSQLLPKKTAKNTTSNSQEY